MTGEWKALTLDQLGFVGRGKSRHRPRNDPALYGGMYPFIQTADIMASEFRIRSYSQTYSEAGLAQSKLWKSETLCMTIAGANTGETAILDFPACFPDSVVGFVPDKAKCDIRFVKYKLDTMIEAFRSISRGATQDNLSLDKLLSFPLLMPPLPEQQHIAAILSAYDDLIENNTRRIAILEEMARRLYEEWFVHFRFPGHEEEEFIETKLGATPSGWPVVDLERVALVNPRTRVPREGTKPFVPMGSLSELSMIIQPIEEREGNSGTKFQNGDTLVARITPCLENGKTGYVDFLSDEQPVAFGSTEFIVLRPLILGSYAIYCLARSHTFRDTAIKSMSGAEGRQRVRPESVQSFPVAQPPADLLAQFERLLEPAFAHVSVLAKKNANLRAQRDLLLPKLVSGEIDVSEAEEVMEAAE